MILQNILSISLRKNFICLIINVRRTKIHSHSFFIDKTIFISQKGHFLQLCDYSSKCWQCNYPYKSEFFCSKCKVLQKLPEELNYFDIIGVKKDFDITIGEIQKKYRQLQALLHPDKFAQKSEQEKDISKDLSALVNKAYSTLLNPLERGIYMLKLCNVHILDETSNVDQEFLMEIMEKNEEIENMCENKEKVLELSKENREIIGSLTKQISKAFHTNDVNEAKKLLIKMKYYVSIDNRLKQFKQNLNIVE